MEILPYEPSLLDEIAVVYNETSTRTPYCYPVTPEFFGTIAPAAGRPTHERLQSEQMLVARDGGDVLGSVRQRPRTGS